MFDNTSGHLWNSAKDEIFAAQGMERALYSIARYLMLRHVNPAGIALLSRDLVRKTSAAGRRELVSIRSAPSYEAQIAQVRRVDNRLGVKYRDPKVRHATPQFRPKEIVRLRRP